MNDVVEKKVGRKSAQTTDRIAMDEILLSKEKTNVLVGQIKRFSFEKDLHKQRGSDLREDIKASAEALGISVAKLNQLIVDYDTGDLDEVFAVKTSYVDVLTILNEKVNSEQ